MNKKLNIRFLFGLSIIMIVCLFSSANAYAFPKTVITSKNSTSVYATTQNAFYASNSSLAGQCTWYVYGRVIELADTGYLDSSVTSLMKNAFWGETGRHAKNWPSFLGGDWIATNSDPLPLNKRRKGLIAVWIFGDYGHVAFVEEVSADKTKYRLSEFNRSVALEYKDDAWYPFEGNDMLGGVYPHFYELPLASGDSATYAKAQHRLPPVIYSLDIPQTVYSNQDYSFRWSVMGYHETYDIIMNVYDKNNNRIASRQVSPYEIGLGQYRWDDVRSNEFFYETSVNLNFAGSQNLTVRFFASPVNDPIDNTFLSCLVPGGLGYEAGDTTGRKILIYGQD